MLRAWVDNAAVGTFDRLGRFGTTFSYDHAAPADGAVSLSMPVRTQSYDMPSEFVPVFDMNLPEGALRERLAKRFAKGGALDDMDALALTGHSQIGRVSLGRPGQTPDRTVPLQSVNEILAAKRGGELHEHVMETFARHSGLSGVQPKAMVRDVNMGARGPGGVQGATHIVKFWNVAEYPELAANEFFCLKAAGASGMPVPWFALSDTGEALVVERFDLRDDGTYRGFEDLCVLNGVTAARKYQGGYETKVFRCVDGNLPFGSRLEASRELFRALVFNCAVRNGDAHLKNFGLLYDTPSSVVSLAPAYDIVTTCAYLPKDRMALTLNGSTDWPDRKRLQQIGQMRARLSPAAVVEVMESMADALTDVAAEARAYFADCPNPEVGERMLAAWDDGIRTSLGFEGRDSLVQTVSAPSP